MLTINEITNLCNKPYNGDEKFIINGKTPEKTVGSIMYTSYSANDKGGLKKCENPLRWGLKDYNYDNESDTYDIEFSENEEEDYSERNLHKFLVCYMRSKDGDNPVYCKTVYHEGSKKDKKGQYRWTYPDIVGVKFLFDKYENTNIIKLKQNIGEKPFYLYSFEMKKAINTSNLTEEYFQTVANSSWANYGYLVAEDIDDTDTSLNEKMERLCNKFGIGIIKLNIEHYSQSVVLYEARLNEDVDFETINLLSNINNDYETFISKCNEYIKLEYNQKSYKELIINNFFDKFYDDEDIAYSNLTNDES